MFSPTPSPMPQAPPPVPGPDTAAVLDAQRETERRRAGAKGRASTYLTDPSAQMDPGPSRRRVAYGGDV